MSGDGSDPDGAPGTSERPSTDCAASAKPLRIGDEYETGLKRSDVKVPSGNPEPPYHAKDYDRCYACHRGSDPGAGKQW